MADLYGGLHEMDVIGPMASVMKPNGPWYIDCETKLITADEAIPHDSPWVMIKPPKGLNCRLYYDVFFRHFGAFFDNPPIRCQQCWKVVVKPKTIGQLLQLMELQDQIKDEVYGCKCGIEKRHYVNGLYGGYFYNRIKKEGKKCLKFVEEKVNEKIGDIPVFLKRGCTEMEQKFGDSTKWKVTPDQLAKEQKIAGLVCNFKDPVQPQYVKIHIIKTWIEYACANGDETYIDFVKKPLHAIYKKYTVK